MLRNSTPNTVIIIKIKNHAGPHLFRFNYFGLVKLEIERVTRFLMMRDFIYIPYHQ